VVSDSVTAAAVLGCGVPMIAVAPALATRLEADELDRVLVHEWAHVQRRDDLVNLLQIAIRIVAGWHPAVWWIDRRLQAEREIACDETTVAITGAPKSYAACLVKLAGLTSVATVPLAAPGVLAARGLRVRITRIVSQGAFLAPQWSFSCAAAIAAVLAVVSVAVAQTKLVEAAVFELPYESIRIAGARLESLAPVAVPVALSRQETASAPSQRTQIAARREPPSIEVGQAPASSVTQEAGAPLRPRLQLRPRRWSLSSLWSRRYPKTRRPPHRQRSPRRFPSIAIELRGPKRPIAVKRSVECRRRPALRLPASSPSSVAASPALSREIHARSPRQSQRCVLRYGRHHAAVAVRPGRGDAGALRDTRARRRNARADGRGEHSTW
jgi:hypothetical protein